MLSWWTVPSQVVPTRSEVRHCALIVTPDTFGLEVRTRHAVAAWALVVAMHADAPTVDVSVTQEHHVWTARVEIDEHRSADEVLAQIPTSAELPTGEVCIEARPRRGADTWDCGLSVRLAPRLSADTLLATIVSDPPGLDEGFLSVLADHLEHAYACMRGPADRLPLSDRDRRVYERLNAARPASAHPRRIEDAVAQAARDHPDRIAVEDGDDEYSYGDLLAEAARIERSLAGHGCTSGDRVVVMLPRSMEFIATKLAVLRLGAVYVPCEPRWPRAQIDEMLEQLQPVFVVSEHASGIRISPPQGPRQTSPEHGGRTADDAACIMFTSGSTGAPKGVVLPHRAFTRLVDGDGHRLFSSSTVCLGAGSVQWDIWAFETWGTLIAGGKLVVHRELHPTPETVRMAVARGVNTAWITAALLNVFVDEDISCLDGLELLLSGGERLSPRHIARIQARNPELRVVNGYGTVEVGVFASLGDCDPVTASAGGDLSIGTPADETAVYVVDRHPDGPRLCPVDTIGELAIAGPGLSLGYFRLPAETEASYVTLRVSEHESVRAYLTGDLGILGHDCRLHYRGRRDRQLKVRGVRVEPGAVEDVLQDHPDVARAAVLPLHNPDGLVDALAAYVVCGDARPELDASAVRSWLGERLPRQVIPRHIEQVPDLPRTGTGKLAVSELARRLPSDGQSPDVGRLDAEGLAAIMAEILSVPVVNESDSFFDLGGDSLLATRLAARLGAMTGRHVSVADIIDAPTPRELDAMLRTAHTLEYAPLPKPPAEADAVPISPGQARHLVGFLADRRGTGSVVQCVHTIDGSLDADALARAWRAVVGAHEALRTVIDIRHAPPIQVVLPVDELPLRHEVAETTWEDMPREAARLATEELRPLDITAEPLTHARLVTNDRQAILAITQHHVITDGWSERIMLDHLSRAYDRAVNGGSDEDLLPEVLGYRAYTQWYAETVRRVGNELRAYWADRLAELPSLPSLAPSSSKEAPRELHWRLDPDATAEWSRTAAAHGVSILSLLVNRYARSLREVTGAGDFAVGLLVSGRSHAAFDETIGFFLNTVPVRVRPGDGGLGLAEHHEAVMSAVGHSLLPFDEIVTATRARRSARHPLAQAMLTMQPGPPPVLELRDCAVRRVNVPSVEDPFELTLEAWMDDGALTGGLFCPAAADGDLLERVREGLLRPPTDAARGS
jgi:mycobactin peptide synthetase MbtE